MKVRLGLVVLCIMMVFAGVAGAEENYVGSWDGAIDLPGVSLEIHLRLELLNGVLVGEMDIPMQGAMGIPLQDFRVTEGTLQFKLAGIPGDPFVIASLSEDGQTLEGTFEQSGMSFPVAVVRKEEVQEQPHVRKTLEEKIADIRASIEEHQASWDVPGTSVGILYRDQVVLLDGFGYRNQEEGLPATGETIYAIGSATKAFATASVALLVDRGLLNWDHPIANYIPWFRLYSVEDSLRVTPRDMALHRTGVSRSDFAWYGRDLDRESFVRLIKDLEPVSGFRENFEYNNFMYTALGYLVEEITGISWEQFIAEEFFGPLGMTASNLSVRDTIYEENYALPYVKKQGEVLVTSFRNLDAMAPAGSINSNVEDMLKWVQLFLKLGNVGEEELLRSQTIMELQRAQLALPTAGFAEIRFSNYALGWMVDDYRGEVLIHHGGNIDGFSSLIAMVPQRQLGIVVLTNMNSSLLPHVITYDIVDRMLDKDPVDWSSRYLGLLANAPEDSISPPRQIANTTPSRNLKEYTGSYEHPSFGTLIVSFDEEKQGLIFAFRDQVAELKHWHYDVFAARIHGYAINLHLPLHFGADLAGNIRYIEAPLEPSLAPLRFTLGANPLLSNQDYLSQFEGTYELMGMALDVFLRGDQLFMDIPGDSPSELLPLREFTFVLKGDGGYAVAFLVEEGMITGLVLDLPFGSFEAPRVLE